MIALAGCASATVVIDHNSPVSSKATGVEPDGIAYWGPKHGLLVATITTPACLVGTSRCPGGLIETTDDGGRTWRVVDHVDVPLNAVAVSGDDVAWVTSGRCTSPASPDGCDSSLLFLTTDRGKSWEKVRSHIPVTSVSPVSATTAWAVSGIEASVIAMETTDGGASWHRSVEPCAASASSGGDLWSVDFPSETSGWAMCTSEPATDMQPKALFVTSDGGDTWLLKSSTTCGFPSNGTQIAPVGDLQCVGYFPGISFLANGHGWEWTDRFGLASTSDGGSTWSTLATAIVTDDVNEVLSASLVSDTTGFLLIDHPETVDCQVADCSPRLLSTANGGNTWTTLHSWSPPPDG